jgi:hypothetical protein
LTNDGWIVFDSELKQQKLDDLLPIPA